MPTSALPTILKRNLNRTVTRAREADGREVVIKRFHAEGALRRLGDRGRARREYASLARLRAEGVAVPTPLAWRRRDGAWELVAEWIPDTHTLGELMSENPHSLARDARLPLDLGRLLASVHACGLDHRDLHPGNVLIGEGGGVWLIDLGGARFRRRFGAPLMVRDLIILCAGVREILPAGFRTRFFSAWWSALPARLRAALPERRTLIEGLEARARGRRRAVVLDNRARWLRESGVCRRSNADGHALLVTREPDRLGDEPVLVRVHSRERWADSGRAADHAIPCARPLRLREGSDVEGLLGLPAGAERCDRRQAPPSGRLFFGAGLLLGILRDRGLDLAELRADALWVDGDGQLFLGPGPRLEARHGARWPRLVGLPSPRTRRERACFAAGYVRSCRGTVRERAELRREMIDG